MKRRIAIALLFALAASTATAQVALPEVQALRREQKDDKDRAGILYQFEPRAGEFLSAVAQSARRGKAAAEEWTLFDRSEGRIAMVADSPFGGGETSKTYWPAEVRPELLRNLLEPLAKFGLKADLPGLPPASAEADKAPAAPAKPWPKIGFSDEYEFVLLVGLHHEPIPYEGTRRRADGTVIYARGSRANAWAILFHAPTGSAFWATTAVARIGHLGVADPVNVAAETVLGYLEFDGIGAHNIPAHIQRLSELQDLHVVDVAAMLAQTQRADAIDALIKLAVSKPAYRMKPRVLRYFNERGTPQDYRLDPAGAKARKWPYVAGPLPLRIMLMEQLGGMRSVRACSVAAMVPLEEDFQIGPLGQSLAGRLGPLGGDDEIILITELAHSDRQRIFRRNYASAVRNLGKCRVHVDEAMAVAKLYADRKSPPPRRGGRPRPDPLKEAGKAALAELRQTKARQQQKDATKGNY